jgi:DNA polymerase III epsilon subunit-like protein
MNAPKRPVLPETFISVDIETAGPVPSEYSMLSIGACLVEDPETTFYVEIKPEHDAVVESALAVTHLSLDVLEVMGLPPVEAMESFADWVEEVVPPDHRAIFTAFNAAFDWMFIADYFHRHLGRNPFGYSALDIKAFAMGSANTTWAQTSMDFLAERHLAGRALKHHALSDAQDQAELFRHLLEERKNLQLPHEEDRS